MEKIKSFMWFTVRTLLAMIIINAVLSFFGGTVQMAVLNPVGFVKGLFTTTTTTTP